MEIIKKLKPTFDFIHELETNYQMRGLPFAERASTLTLNVRSLRLDFKIKTKDALNLSNVVRFNDFLIQNKNNSKCFIVSKKNHYLNSTINTLGTDEENCSCSINISHLMEEMWVKEGKYFYRFVFPIERDYWTHDINTLTYHTDRLWSRGLIPIKFPEGVLHTYPIHGSNSHYIVVDSLFACTYDDMQKYIYAISLSLGLATSIITFDYAYVFAGNDALFDKDILCGFAEMRPTIKGQYKFFTTNMYSLREMLKDNNVKYASGQFYDEKGIFLAHLQDWIQLDEFERIVLMLYNNEELARAVLILIESSTMSLDYEGAMCAVALETICSAMYKPKQKTLMKNEDWKRNVVPKFENLIQSLIDSNTISEMHADIIRRKLNGLNMDTNADKLSKPFECIGYNLTESDKKNIAKRNRFLHGNIVGHTHQESFDEILYTCMEIQKLCAVLLFRNAGFKGLIVNNAVLMGLKRAVDEQEPVLIG